MQWSTDIWTDEDGGGGATFEPYGNLTIDIGLRAEYQDLLLWRVESDALLVPMGTSKIFTSNLKFQESKEFQRDGLVTLHGKTMESSPNEIMGDYEGKIYAAKILLNGVSVTYHGVRTHRVTINMTLLTLT